MLLERDLNEASEEELDELINNFIDRSSHQTGEMPAEIFFELLFENERKRTQQTIPLTLSIKACPDEERNGEVEFHLPPDREAPILAYNNEIFVGDTLLVVTLQNGNQ